jgi:hypothetical protein
MFKIKFIDATCCDNTIAELDKHLAKGNIGEFEIHLDSAYGIPFYASKIKDYASAKNIKLKTYCTGNICDGGVALIFGCENNIAYHCTTLYVNNKPLDEWVLKYYRKHEKCSNDPLNYIMNDVLDDYGLDDDWYERDEPIYASELLEYGVFEEIRQEYKSSQIIKGDIIAVDLNPKDENGHICECDICSGEFSTVLPSEWCKCGARDPFTFMASECPWCNGDMNDDDDFNNLELDEEEL